MPDAGQSGDLLGGEFLLRSLRLAETDVDDLHAGKVRQGLLFLKLADDDGGVGTAQDIVLVVDIASRAQAGTADVDGARGV